MKKNRIAAIYIFKKKNFYEIFSVSMVDIVCINWLKIAILLTKFRKNIRMIEMNVEYSMFDINYCFKNLCS